MAEDLNFSGNTSKEETYKELIPQLKALITGEDDLIANLANLSLHKNSERKRSVWYGLGKSRNFNHSGCK